MNTATLSQTAAAIFGIHLNEGELYAGLILSEDGTPSHHLISLPGEKTLTWDEAIAWAESENAHVPDSQEGALLFANLRKHFARTWYWLGTQYSTRYAWYQNFIVGTQFYAGKSYEGRVRLVRRLPFNSSAI